eukprot:gene13144-8990_t
MRSNINTQIQQNHSVKHHNKANSIKLTSRWHPNPTNLRKYNPQEHIFNASLRHHILPIKSPFTNGITSPKQPPCVCRGQQCHVTKYYKPHIHSTTYALTKPKCLPLDKQPPATQTNHYHIKSLVIHQNYILSIAYNITQLKTLHPPEKSPPMQPSHQSNIAMPLNESKETLLTSNRRSLNTLPQELTTKSNSVPNIHKLPAPNQAAEYTL